MPRLIVLLLSLFICVTPATASTLYTFSGANGLSGSFVLDETTPFAITISPLFGTSAELRSPLNHISGTFNAFSFVGVPFLTIADLPAGRFLNASDFWIVRAPISGPAVNGLTPQQLNLFIYRNSDSTTPISLVPPVPTAPNPFDFQYTFGFSDGSFVGGPLSTLAMVPEPATITTLALGLIALMALGFSRRSQLSARNC
jgi:PEP-CTERM motif